jgi:hypothetical protein
VLGVMSVLSSGNNAHAVERRIASDDRTLARVQYVCPDGSSARAAVQLWRHTYLRGDALARNNTSICMRRGIDGPSTKTVRDDMDVASRSTTTGST